MVSAGPLRPRFGDNHRYHMGAAPVGASYNPGMACSSKNKQLGQRIRRKITMSCSPIPTRVAPRCTKEPRYEIAKQLSIDRCMSLFVNFCFFLFTIVEKDG